MSQYKPGGSFPLVNVTNGSATVVITGQNAVGQVEIGDTFYVSGLGTGRYDVGAVAYSAPNTNITLTAPYAGTTTVGATGVFHRDFTSTLGLPLVNDGDLEFAALNRRQMELIDQHIAAPTFLNTLRAQSGSAVSILVGADSTGTTLTNATEKSARIATPHYTNAEEPVGLIYAVAQAAANLVRIGGGSGGLNAATTISFYVAANNTTTTGTSVLSLTSSLMTVVIPISSTGTITVTNAAPALALNDTSEAADARQVRLFVDSGNIRIGSYSDAGALQNTLFSLIRSSGNATLLGTVTATGATLSNNGTVNLTVSSVADAQQCNINFATAGVNMWSVYKTPTANAGSNAGSDFEIISRTDAGGGLSNCFSIKRSTGNSIFGSTAASDDGIHKVQISGSAKVAGDIRASSTSPSLYLEETDAAVDEKLWRVVASTGDLIFQARNDANSSGANWLTVARTGTVVDSITAGGKVVLPASTTTAASLNVPHGTAPSSPVNGDIWTTTAGLYVRINGVTRLVTVT